MRVPLLLLLFGTTAYARPAADTLTAIEGKPLRTHATLDFTPRATTAWKHFASTGTWQAAWDPATNVPTRIWGSGIPTPGAMADAALAEAYASGMLEAHLGLLAPGAAITDFILVSDHTDGEIRSIGFAQYAHGLRVVGGQVSFRFKADRLFVIASDAFPDVVVSIPKTKHVDIAKLRTVLELPDAPITTSETVILPLVSDAGVVGYSVTSPMTIDGGADGRYLAYFDPSGAIVAVEQQNNFATGTLLYRGVDRHPLRGRIDKPARTAKVTVAGAEQTTGTDGSLTIDTPQTITTGVVGNLVEIVNKGASGALASTQLPIAPGGTAVWDASANSEDDAQVVTFLAINQAKDFVRVNIDPEMPDLDKPIKANVNIPKSCNAFFDGATVNFFAASMSCQNTGRIEDVVFHEFGHAVHHAEIIDGVGRFDGAMSEGAADFLAGSMTGDSGMGRGLFYNEEPLREFDPPNDEFRWPDDVGEIHGTGRIYAGALWDMRKALIAQYGATQGAAMSLKIFLGTMRRAKDIPTSFIEALATDDNDGNLANGTPNECLIRAAFGRHGLRDASGVVDAPATLFTTDADAAVKFKLSGLSERCPAVDAIDRALLIWVPSYTRLPVAGSTLLTRESAGVFTGRVPLPKDDVVFFSARVQFTDGTMLQLADNMGDRFYQIYQGETVPLYCTSFDDDPFAEGWRTGTSDGMPSPWVWAVPDGNPDDPPAAFTGTHVLMQGGKYNRMQTTYVELPSIDVGQWSDVHVQYRRWLMVEDSEFDKAKISVDGGQAFLNGTAGRGDSSSNATIDKEWRFHDVRVSGYTQGNRIRVAFELQADPGLQLGGWGIDDLCVVANVHSICGDGVQSPTEQCDEGDANGNQPNACRAWCAKARCGDYIVDDKEECDDGLAGSKECTQACKSLVEVGCCSSSPRPMAPVMLTVVVLFVLRRRKPRLRRGAQRRRAARRVDHRC